LAFDPADRALLLAAPQLGPGLISRLEAAGFHSIAELRSVGAEAAMHAVCEHAGQRALANRVRALRRALEGSFVPAPAVLPQFGASNGRRTCDRSLRVSTSTSGPSSRTTGGLGSRGTCTGLGSAAIAA